MKCRVNLPYFPQKIEMFFCLTGEGVVPLNKTKDNRFYSQLTTHPLEHKQSDTMTQALIHKLAERVLFNKNGGSSKQKSAIYQNVKAIRKALKCPKDSKGIQRKPSAQVILAALNGRGWHHRTSSSSCMDRNEGGDGTSRELATYGGVVANASGRKSFKVTDRRLQKIWNAISKFVQEYGGDLQLTGDLLLQQASLLVLLNRRYQQIIATKEADSYAFTQGEKEKARLLRQEQRKEALCAVRIQALIRGAMSRSSTLQSTLSDLSGCFGEWDDEEDMEKLNQRAVETARINAELKAMQQEEELQRATAEAQAQTEWLESFMKKDAPAAAEGEEGAKKKKKKKKKKSHQVRKMEAAKARKKAGKR